MPQYSYYNPKNPDEIITTIQRMSDVHEFEKDGIKWVRKFDIPNASFDTVVDPNNSKDFIKATNNKKGSVGDLWDRSAELAKKRQDKYGYDEVKEKYYQDWKAKDKKKRDHPDVKKRKAKEKMAKLGVDISI
jgi:hypothetical protein